MEATKDPNLRRLLHPPLLKIFKRDGVLIFEDKNFSTISPAPLMPDLNAAAWPNSTVLIFEFLALDWLAARQEEGCQGDRFLGRKALLSL